MHGVVLTRWRRKYDVSPYTYLADNPCFLFVDPDGQFPYPIHIRSFAPFKSIWWRFFWRRCKRF
jgi:hypothetical protein